MIFDNDNDNINSVRPELGAKRESSITLRLFTWDVYRNVYTDTLNAESSVFL